MHHLATKPEALAADITRLLDAASATVSDIEHRSLSVGLSPQDDEEQDFNYLRLEDLLTQASVGLQVLLESMGLQRCLEEFREEYKALKSITYLQHVPYIDVLVSDALSIITRYSKAVSSLLGNDADSFGAELSLLEQMLRGTPKMLADSGLIPSNEAEVKKVIYQTLLHVFPSTVREVPIPKVAKTFRPDIGIRDLRAAVEYKFAGTADELKTAFGGIYEDTRGYAGSEDWKRFYAVVYMTDAFMTQDQADAEFRVSEVEESWKIILVQGRGERSGNKVKTRASAPRKKPTVRNAAKGTGK